MRKAFGWAGIVVLLVAMATVVRVWTASSGRFGTTDRAPQERDQPSSAPFSNRSANDREPGAGSPPPSAKPVAPRPTHPLLGRAEEAVLVEGSDRIRGTARSGLMEVVRTVVQSAKQETGLASLTVDYPFDETIFPPDIVPPTFLWHEPADRAETWLVDVAWSDAAEPIRILVPGSPPEPGRIDSECIAENNEIYQPTPYQASAKSWTVNEEVWARIRQRSVETPARVTILGFRSDNPKQVLSRGEISFTVSKHPVGAPVFYRDVPLAPAVTQKGVIAPLGENAVALIAWRLRDVSKPESRLLLNDVPTCTNCHSFSADGNTLGMDLDGPDGDKGSYVIAPIVREMVIGNEHVISWNSFAGKPPGDKTIGFLSRISPDGQYAATTLNEQVFVANFLDYKFLQVFYPTRGVLGYYSRATREIKTLPGADDPSYVHCDPVWTPDGRHLIFARAAAREAYPEGSVLPDRPNAPAEPQVRYDLYRIPFRGGQGGQAEPLAGASNNGLSNNFPKVSPDGKWIVFVQCRNGQLLRPDSTLWIVPAAGGTARKMRCNTALMNSWHSFSPNGRWMVFSSKANTPYTQMFLTHIDQDGNDSPPVLVPNSTAANRAVNLPEFVNRPYDDLVSIRVRALEHLQRGLRGVQLARQGKLDEALAELDAAIKLQPDYWQGHVNAAVVLIDQGKLDEAMTRLKKVLEANPNRAHAYGSVGVVLAKRGMIDEAMAHFQKAIQLDPAYTEAHSNLGRLLQKQGRLPEATAHFFTAMNIQQDSPLAHYELASVLLERQMHDLAIEHFQKALELDSHLLDAHLALAKAWAARGDYPAAVKQLEKAAAVEPDNLRPVNDLAWLLAICPRDDVRNGAQAVQLAERACQATGHANPVLLSTLAAAYSEVGRFPEAIETASKALALVLPEDKALAQGLRQQLQLYGAGKPCRYLAGTAN